MIYRAHGVSPSCRVVTEVFLPTPDGLLVNLNERRQLVTDLLKQLPTMFEKNMETGNALGPALQAAYKLMVRVSVHTGCLQLLVDVSIHTQAAYKLFVDVSIHTQAAYKLFVDVSIHTQAAYKLLLVVVRRRNSRPRIVRRDVCLCCRVQREAGSMWFSPSSQQLVLAHCSAGKTPTKGQAR